MSWALSEVDKVEVLTLQDNYVDLVVMDDTPVIHRARPLKDGELKNSILAEHGFSAVVSVQRGQEVRSALFDFGFSEDGAALNSETLDQDMSRVEVCALSHGHPDHVGGLKRLAEKVGKRGIQLVLHPAAFTRPRYIKVMGDFKVYFPPFTVESAQDAGAEVITTSNPYLLLGGTLLYLGEIPRRTKFEKGMPNAYCEDAGQEKWDPIPDDTALVAHIKGKGLVVLSGCAHSGIVNTVTYAKEVTGVDKVHVVMGGFHLTGPAFEGVIEPTIQALKKLDPDYVIPTHCTGRQPIMRIEQEMPDKFILNMAGTRLTFAA